MQQQYFDKDFLLRNTDIGMHVDCEEEIDGND
jgi:hypothetical protein